MDSLLKKENLDMQLTPYRVHAVSYTSGMVQFIPSISISQVLQTFNRDILQFLKKQSEHAALQMQQQQMQLQMQQHFPLNIVPGSLAEGFPAGIAGASGGSGSGSGSSSNSSPASSLTPTNSFSVGGLDKTIMDNFVRSCGASLRTPVFDGVWRLIDRLTCALQLVTVS